MHQITPYFITALLAVGVACSSNTKNETETASNESTSEVTETTSQASSDEGVGPFKNISISGEPDLALVEQGKALFESRCTACHKFDERYVGPALGGVTERRKPAWVMNMIINPTEMLQEDPVAKELLAEYMTPMVNMNVNEDDTRAIYEYLRAHDQGKAE